MLKRKLYFIAAVITLLVGVTSVETFAQTNTAEEITTLASKSNQSEEKTYTRSDWNGSITVRYTVKNNKAVILGVDSYTCKNKDLELDGIDYDGEFAAVTFKHKSFFKRKQREIISVFAYELPV